MKKKPNSGDKVWIKTREQLGGQPDYWNSKMLKYCGQLVTVDSPDPDDGWCMKVKDGTQYWSFKPADIDWEKTFPVDTNKELTYPIY